MAGTIAEQLDDAESRLRGLLTEEGISRAEAYRADFQHLSIPAPEVARIADRLADARRQLSQASERERVLRARITRLESSTGALMVDRTRGIDEANRRAEGARQVASDCIAVLREHGIDPGAELATLVEDATQYGNHVFGLLDRERLRLDEFRCTMVQLIQQCQDRSRAGNGLTPGQVGILGRAIDRANSKARG